ncbi:MAG TPA: hypothetical protein VGM56_31255 [Byssovorax sp.]
MTATVVSRCECQASLHASLDAERHVVEGAATRHGKRESAPAHSIAASAKAERFDVAWLCPFCGRNTLRSFDAGAVRAS